MLSVNVIIPEVGVPGETVPAVTGKVYVVSIATPNEPFELKLSLKGFTAAWNSVPQPSQ